MFLSAPANTILFCSIHDYAGADQKILTRIGLCMMTASMALGSQMYFVQFTTVRQNIARGTLAGLEQFAQQNHSSAITAIGMLGWTFFFGLAFLFVAPVFSGGRLERWIGSAFLVCGISAIIGGFAYLFEDLPLQIAYVVGITIAGTLSVIFLAVLFRRLERDLASAPHLSGGEEA